MTPDERTILLLAAEALRSDRLTHEACVLLADALDRIAGEGHQKRTTGIVCQRCGDCVLQLIGNLCVGCRTWVEAEEKGEKP